MDKKHKIIGGAIAVTLFVLILWFGFSSSVNNSTNTQGNSQNSVQSDRQPGAKAPSSLTRSEASLNVIVPDKGETDVPSNVAVPNIVTLTGPDQSVIYRNFDIKIDNDEFTPNTIISRKGDLIRVSFTAVDKNYDFTQPDFGFHISVPKGQTKGFQTTNMASGKFLFYCQSCGGPSKGPTGYLEVIGK